MTRRVLAASCTAQPSGAWVTQQSRNLTWKLEEEGIELSVVVHDRDKKFAHQADVVFSRMALESFGPHSWRRGRMPTLSD